MQDPATPVNNQVPDKYRRSDTDLKVPGQPLGVDDRGQVGFNESAVVSPLAGHSPEMVFQWRQGANPTVEFQEDRPDHGGKVK